MKKILLTEVIKLLVKRIEEGKLNDNWDEFVSQFYFKGQDGNFYIINDIDLLNARIDYDTNLQFEYFDDKTIVYQLEED